MDIFSYNVIEHFESCDNEVYTSSSSTRGDIVSEVKQINDAEEDLEYDIEEEFKISAPSILEIKLAANILYVYIYIYIFQKMWAKKYLILF